MFLYCSKAIRYGTTGKKSLRLHCEDKKHINNIKCLKKNTTIPGASRTMGQTSFADRVAELRCVTVAFISENTLPDANEFDEDEETEHVSHW